MRNTLCGIVCTHAIVRNIYSRTKCTEICNFQVRNDMFSTTIYIDFWLDIDVFIPPFYASTSKSMFSPLGLRNGGIQKIPHHLPSLSPHFPHH